MRLIQTDTNILLINRHASSSQDMKNPGNSTFPRLVCEGGYRDLKRNHRSESGLFPPFSGLPVPVMQT